MSTLVSFDSATSSVTEADSVSNHTVTVSRTLTNGEASVAFATSDGTASAGSDYTATSDTLNFVDGESSKTITIPILGDSINEGDKTFNITLSSATAEFGSISISGTNPHVVTITDDDTTTISFASGTTSVTEANTTHTVNVTRSNTNGTASVQFTTSDNTAGTGSDYTAVSGTLNFADGVSSATISVDILEDAVYEESQTFNIILSNPSAQFGGVSIGGGVHVVTILDDDSLVISFDSSISSVTEGTSPHTVAVNRSSSVGIASVDFATSAGTAFVGSDFSSSSGRLSFSDGETTKNISILIDDDDVNEDTEIFTITLSSPTAEHGSASLGTSSHTVTIVDNDSTVVSFSTDNSSVTESSTTHSITVTRSNSSGTATVDYATSNGTATAGSDYTGISTTQLSFADGESTATINVTILGDSINESDETFVVTLSNVDAQYGSATLGTSAHTVTILNDDTSVISFASLTSSVSESAGSVSITVNRSDTNGTASINYATANGTATAGSDYTAITNGLLSFANGEGSKAITINITSDTTNENDETFTVNLSNPVTQHGAMSIGTGTHTVTITNDDSSIISFSSLTSSTSESSTPHLIQIQRTDSNGSATVDFTTTGVTATGDNDYSELSGTANFAAGQSSVNISLPIIQDLVNEADETLQLTLSNATSEIGSISIDASNVHTITIIDDDTTEIYTSPSSSSVSESNSGSFIHTVTVIRTRTNGTASVDYATSDVTATAGSDYVGITSTTLNFANGVSTATISIEINGDTDNENDETFNLTLSNPVSQYGSAILVEEPNGSSFDTFNHVITIPNDDPSIISFQHSTSTVSEGDTVSITVNRSKPNGTASVVFSTSDGTASLSGSDYVETDGTLNFLDGESSKTISIPTEVDGNDENNETFFVTLSSPTSQFGTISIEGVNPHIITILGTGIIEGPVSTENILSLHGRTMGFSYSKKYLGEMFGNYASVKTINFSGYTSQLNNTASANSDHKGVSESFSDINNIIATASDNLTTTFVINGVSVGRGRITSLDFSENNNPIQSIYYSLTLEIYDDLVENINTSFQEEIAGQTSIYPTNNFSIQSYDSQYIQDISENFSFDKSEDDSFSYQHTFNVKYVSGHHADLVTHAQNLANVILNPAAGDRPNFPFNDDFNDTSIDGENSDFRSAYNNSLVEAGEHRFDETYDLVNANFTFVRKFRMLGSKGVNTTSQHSRSLTLGEDGHASVTENGTVDAINSNDTSNLNDALDTIVASSFDRCNNFWKASQGNLTRTDRTSAQSKGGTITASSDLYSQYVTYGRNVNPHNGSINYTITYTNNPRYTANGIKEFSLSVNEDFENSSLSISENGTIRPYGNVGIDYDKGFDNSANVASVLTEADSRITAEFSSYLNLALAAVDSPRGWRTYSHKDEVIKRTSYNITYPKFGKIITYSADYSADGSFLSPSDTTAFGIHSVNVEYSDNTPNLIKRPYLIPNNGEIVQTRKQTTVGTRDISINAQRVRDGNYLTNPPDLSAESPAIIYLKNVALVMVNRIPLSYAQYIINDIFISDYNYSFNSETGQISLNLQASFTMASVDTNGANNTIKPKRYRI